jgi:hypothetical protein
MKDQQFPPAKLKLYEKPLKLFSKISLFNQDTKPKMLPTTKLWPEKEPEDDRLPESGTGQ